MLDEIFRRYEQKLRKRLMAVMAMGANSLVREHALKVLEYEKIFREEV
jgi:hypothetical protein